MNKVIRVIVALSGILFVIIGFRWLVDPARVAKSLGMPLLEGLGRSSQIGDFGAFFTAGGHHDPHWCHKAKNAHGYMPRQ